MIVNTYWVKVPNPARRLPIKYIGFDLWQVTAGTLFGTIVLADNVDDIEPYLWDKEMFEAERKAKEIFDIGKAQSKDDEVKDREESKSPLVEEEIDLHDEL